MWRFLTRRWQWPKLKRTPQISLAGLSILPRAEKFSRGWGRCCHTTQLSSDTATADDFFEKVLLDDLATPNRQMIPANIFWGGVHEILVVKRSVDINGHKTSVSLEDAFWSDLKEIAHMQRVTLSKLITEIDKARQGNLSSAIRLFVFEQVRAHGNLWRYSRSRRAEEETTQMNGLPVRPSG